MNILVCVKRVPATGGRIVLTDDARTSTPVPRLHRQPARGVRGRGGRPDRRGARRLDDRADAGPAEADDQLRDAMAIGVERASTSRPMARDWDPVATAARTRRAIRAPGGRDGPFDLILFGNESADSGGFQVGIRVATALGRPIVTGAKGLTVAGGHGLGAARGARWLGGLRGAAAGGRGGPRRPEPAALPVRAGPAAGEEEGDRTRVPGARRGRPRADPARRPGRAGADGRDPRDGARGGAARRRVLRQMGVL